MSRSESVVNPDSLILLKKRLDAFRTGGRGQIRRLPDEVLLEFLRLYESWTGSSAEFYRNLNLGKNQFSRILGMARGVYREKGYADNPEFQEIALSAVGMGDHGGAGSVFPCASIEVVDGSRVIRFPSVDPLIEYLRKTAA